MQFTNDLSDVYVSGNYEESSKLFSCGKSLLKQKLRPSCDSGSQLEEPNQGKKSKAYNYQNKLAKNPREAQLKRQIVETFF